MDTIREDREAAPKKPMLEPILPLDITASAASAATAAADINADIAAAAAAAAADITADADADSTDCLVEYVRGLKRRRVSSTQEGKPGVLEAVKKAERLLATENVAPPSMSEYTKLTSYMIFGPDSRPILRNRLVIIPCLSGAGSLRAGAEFLVRNYPKDSIYLPEQMLGMHKKLFTYAGLCVKTYRYYNPETSDLDFEGMKEDLGSAPTGATVLLLACAQGVNPTHEQWGTIKDIMTKNSMLPFLDLANQGFGSGSLAMDAYPVRLFADSNACLVVQSYAENMCLHAQNVGSFSVVCPSAKLAVGIEDQLELLTSPLFPNLHSAAIVATILKDSELFKEWTIELKAMADGIVSMRAQLFAALNARGTKGDWTHITKQVGMYTFTGLSEKQAAFVTKESNIFMTGNGQINMADLSAETLPHLADAIHQSVTGINN